jgi:hypothetical protein
MVPDLTLTVSILSVSYFVITNYYTVVPKTGCICCVCDELLSVSRLNERMELCKEMHAYRENDNFLMWLWIYGYKYNHSFYLTVI